jgi:hypothetical protein
MDGFPNGRRLEDDVTRIELQAVGGVVLAAVGLWYDDYTAGGANPVTTKLVNVLSYTTGVEKNDQPFTSTFPYLAMPQSGTGNCGGKLVTATQDNYGGSTLGFGQQPVMMKNFPNPFGGQTTFKFQVNQASKLTLRVFDVEGRLVSDVFTAYHQEGEFQYDWNATGLQPGLYIANLYDGDGRLIQTAKLLKH